MLTAGTPPSAELKPEDLPRHKLLRTLVEKVSPSEVSEGE